MRREVLDADTLGSGLHHVPNPFWRDPFTPNLAIPVYTTKDPASVDAGRSWGTWTVADQFYI
jgi:hypothetical protein